MTQELKEKIRDMLSIAYQIGFTHKSAGNTAYLEVEEVLNALMDSIILAEKTEIPEPDHIAEIPADNEDDIIWREHYNGEYGCEGCICSHCAQGICVDDCKYVDETFNCAYDCENKVIKECKHFKELEEME